MRLILLLAISQAADVASTGISISRGAHEANPLGIVVLGAGGLLGLLAVKLFLVALAAIGLILLAGRSRKLVLGLGGVTIFTFMAAAWNLVVAATA